MPRMNFKSIPWPWIIATAAVAFALWQMFRGSPTPSDDAWRARATRDSIAIALLVETNAVALEAVRDSVLALEEEIENRPTIIKRVNDHLKATIGGRLDSLFDTRLLADPK